MKWADNKIQRKKVEFDPFKNLLELKIAEESLKCVEHCETLFSWVDFQRVPNQSFILDREEPQ